MSPDKKNEQVKLTGKVTTGIFSKGSKSEHEAVYLETEQGSFILRISGGNPFENPVLKKLAGKMIKAKGRIHNNIFIANADDLEVM